MNTSSPEVDSILAGYYGVRNLGDDLMLACIHRILKQHGCAVTVLAEDAEEVRRLHHVPAEQNYPFFGQSQLKTALLQGRSFRLMRRLLSADILFAGGGDILRDALGLVAFSFQIEKIVCAILANKPVVLINVGITRPQTATGRAVLRWMLPRCRQIIVRDQRSLDLCRELGAEKVTTKLPDVVLALPRLFAAEIAQNPGAQASRPYVVVGLRRTSNVYSGFRLTPERITNFAKGLDELCVRHGVDIHFVSCHDAPAENDHVLHEEIRNRMQMRERTHLLEWTADIPALAAIFGHARAVIAMRLHAGVLGVAFERPTLLLPYDAKVSEFGSYADVRHVLSDEALDSMGRITDGFESLMKDTDPPGPPSSANRWSEPLLTNVVAGASAKR